ncbi:MAG: sigma-70 family RNA polymerase sigma factor [Pirellulales bacterium]|nr:sigma-70 family RNA polymerase sigma factor [Pirellulales bacterium]
MAFPPTRLTLICRIAAGGSEQDWQQFLEDYWGPICRFVVWQAGLSWHDAEDVAAATFEILYRKQLLARWHARRSAKLRTLLCNVVRNILGNDLRIEKLRKDALKRLIEEGGADDLLGSGGLEVPADQADIFYAAWVEDLLLSCVESLRRELHGRGDGDSFRVLYGRVCEELTNAEIADLLELPPVTVENHYRTARERLQHQMKAFVRRHVRRYCDPKEAEDEFPVEWGRLGEYLLKEGGLEAAVRKSHRRSPSATADLRRSDSFITTVTLLRSATRENPASRTSSEHGEVPESLGTME